jgi:molecular chaperone GrpE
MANPASPDGSAAVPVPAPAPVAAGAAPDAAAAVPPLAEQELAEIKTKAAQAQQHYEQLLRTAADLENYRKRAARERAEAVRFAHEGLLQKLVPILDNFEMAMAAAGASNTTVQSLQAGVAMIQQQLKSALTEAGLEEIDATGQPFDPNLHEAVSQEESAQVQEGQVLRQLRRGYKLRERLLRPATVVVAKAAAPAAPAPAGQSS